jgi:hypothetical protein
VLKRLKTFIFPPCVVSGPDQKKELLQWLDGFDDGSTQSQSIQQANYINFFFKLTHAQKLTEFRNF